MCLLEISNLLITQLTFHSPQLTCITNKVSLLLLLQCPLSRERIQIEGISDKSVRGNGEELHGQEENSEYWKGTGTIQWDHLFLYVSPGDIREVELILCGFLATVLLLWVTLNFVGH